MPGVRRGLRRLLIVVPVQSLGLDTPSFGECHELFYNYDLNHDGRINFSEFANMLG